MLCLDILNKLMSESQKIEKANPFGAWLREKRTAKGLSLRGLARLTNGACTYGYISQLESDNYRGKKGNPVKPDREIVIALALALNESPTLALKMTDYSSADLSDLNTADNELAFLFLDSRNWSDENRTEATELATMIFRRYLEKENAVNKRDPIEDEIDRQWSRQYKKASGAQQPTLKSELPGEDEIEKMTNFELKDGKVVKKKKPSAQKKPKDKN